MMGAVVIIGLMADKKDCTDAGFIWNILRWDGNLYPGGGKTVRGQAGSLRSLNCFESDCLIR